jgi:hypothetical protein
MVAAVLQDFQEETILDTVVQDFLEDMILVTVEEAVVTVTQE